MSGAAQKSSPSSDNDPATLAQSSASPPTTPAAKSESPNGSARSAAGTSNPHASTASSTANSTLINRKQHANEIDSFESFADGLDMPDHARLLWGLAPRPAAAFPLDDIANGEAREVPPWELTDALTRSSVSFPTVRHLEASALDYVARYPRTPPDALVRPVRRDLNAVIRHLGDVQTLTTQARLITVAGLLGGISGSISFDRGDVSAANSFFEAAFTATEESEDGDLGAWILATQSLVPFSETTPRQRWI
jgi:hypothetical protein